MGITSCLLTSFHPQTDGQTERLNQTLKQYLRCYALKAKDSWLDLLWLAELSYNNLTHRSIGVSPFLATYGFHPHTLPVTIPTSLTNQPDAKKNITNIHRVHKQIKAHLNTAKQIYKRYADAHRKPGPVYKPGNKVWLSAKNIYFKKPSPFRPKFIGPFSIVKRINPVAYKPALPPTFRIIPFFIPLF